MKNEVIPGRFVVDPPTLNALGFEWIVEGDDNHNATVEVWYRKEGGGAWKQALPLLRIQKEECITSFLNNSIDYVTPNMFAGSIFDLEPDTAYECRFEMFDPDGVVGNARQAVLVRTRPEPMAYSAGNVFHVYPIDYEGPKEEPAFPNLMAAYYTGWCEADWWNTAPPRVQPGDTIIVHAGIYKDDWNVYGADIWGQGTGTPFQGTYFLTAKGLPEKPIAIVAAGDGEVVFDGNGNFNLFNLLVADHHYFEGISVCNTYVAFLAGNKKIAGADGLTVKRCCFRDIDKGIHSDWAHSKNFYIADNTFIGKHDPNSLHGWFKDPIPPHVPPPHYPYEKCLSEYAIKIAGSGHVVCHNYVANFHDGIDHATYGVPEGYPPYAHPEEYPVDEVLEKDGRFVSIDFTNNLIVNVHDNFIEADGAMHNIRVMRNLCISGGAHALSSQTLYGGPAYFIRNIVYHAPSAVKHAQNPSGIIYYHNTFCARIDAAQSSNCHFANNLILAWLPTETLISTDSFTRYDLSDYNGYRPAPDAEKSFVVKSPPPDKLKDYSGEREEQQFASLHSYSEATGKDRHSILVDYDIFTRVFPADPENLTTVYSPDNLNFSLKSDAFAVDAGCLLSNVNDDYTGKAPDLGALETGRPLPVYGPREEKLRDQDI